MSELGDDTTCSVKNYVFCCCLGNSFFRHHINGKHRCENVQGWIIYKCVWKLINVFLSAETLWNTLIPLHWLCWICMVWQQLFPNYIIIVQLWWVIQAISPTSVLLYWVSAQLARDLASVIHRYESQPCSCSILHHDWECDFTFLHQIFSKVNNIDYLKFPTKTGQLVAVYHLCKR